MTPLVQTSAALARALTAPPRAPTADTVDDWWPGWSALATAPGAAAAPLALAIDGGFAADRLGWAFAAGYQAALRALEPSLPPDALAALCVTEAGGNRPRDVLSRFEPAADGGWHLSGAKRWTTLGPRGSLLLVVGRLATGPDGDADARPALRVARVPVPSPGLRIEPMPDTAFVPEVPHARVVLDGVRVPAAALLPGDGYTRVVKPFRTLEDLHVTAAVLAWLLREARARGWPADLRERITATLTALAALAAGPMTTPAAHVALEGALQWAQAVYRDADALWAASPDDPATARWRRDTPLLRVAQAARAQRAARAWEQLEGAG